jgi:hypothetical protein
LLLYAGIAAHTVNAQEPDPKEFTPPGYAFCGWQDFATGDWVMQWREDLGGAYMVAFAVGMSCSAAQRNVERASSGRRPRRPGYRCRILKEGHEFLDVRCIHRSGKRKFRYQTGA